MRDDDRPSEIAKMLWKENQEKKIIARGVHGLASRKRGIKGAVKTPVDYMKGREKKLYTGATKSKNLPMLYSVFLQKSKEEKKELLEGYLKEYPKVKDLAEVWIPLGLPSVDMIYNWRRSLGMKYDKRVKKTKEASMEDIIKEVEETTNKANAISAKINSINSEVEEKIKGISYNVELIGGEISGNELSDRLEDIASSLKNGKTYTIILRLKEE